MCALPLYLVGTSPFYLILFAHSLQYIYLLTEGEHASVTSEFVDGYLCPTHLGSPPENQTL